MKTLKILIFTLSIFPHYSFAQEDIAGTIDGLKSVTDMPYICNGYYIADNGDTIRNGCGNHIFWKVITFRDKAIQPLISTLCDTTQTEATVVLFGGNYTVADVEQLFRLIQCQQTTK